MREINSSVSLLKTTNVNLAFTGENKNRLLKFQAAQYGTSFFN